MSILFEYGIWSSYAECVGLVTFSAWLELWLYMLLFQTMAFYRKNKDKKNDKRKQVENNKRRKQNEKK